MHNPMYMFLRIKCLLHNMKKKRNVFEIYQHVIRIFIMLYFTYMVKNYYYNNAV